MSGERDRGDRPRATRRGVLALAGAGAAALAGCGTVRSVLGSDPVELDAAAVAAVASGPTPSVAEPLPVDVAAGHVDASRNRAESELGSVPLPLTPEELPNGAMRAEIHRTAEHAREVLTHAAEAPGTRERLDRLRHAREHARSVAASWAYAKDELTPRDVRDRARSIRESVRTYRTGWRYVGREPVRALLVHEAVETWTGAAYRYAGRDERARREPTHALTVGEDAGSVEHGAAYLADVRHVGDRFVDSVSDAGSVRPTFESARESLAATVRGRRSDLPSEEVNDPADMVEGDVADGPAARALRDLHWRLPDREDVPPREGLAGDVVHLFRDLAAVDAFESVRDRVEGGDRFAVESVEGLRTRRRFAVEAIRGALDDSPDRRLARSELAFAASRLRDVDRDLDRYEGTVEASHLDDGVGKYVAVAAQARAVPDACAETLDALGA